MNHVEKIYKTRIDECPKGSFQTRNLSDAWLHQIRRGSFKATRGWTPFLFREGFESMPIQISLFIRSIIWVEFRLYSRGLIPLPWIQTHRSAIFAVLAWVLKVGFPWGFPRGHPTAPPGASVSFIQTIWLSWTRIGWVINSQKRKRCDMGASSFLLRRRITFSNDETLHTLLTRFVL